MASTSNAPTAPLKNPLLNLPDNDLDKFSDYLPGSNEMSRDPSRQPTASASASVAGEEPAADEEEDESDVDEMDEDDDDKPTASARKKKPSEIKKAQEAAGRKKAREEKKKQIEDHLTTRKATQASLKSADSIKRFSYLLGQTELFRHFCDLKSQRDPEFAAMLAESEKLLGKKEKATKKGKGARGRKTEKEEDEELLAETKAEDAEDRDGEGPFVFTESPAYVKGGKMREYQVQGLNWMVGLHHNGINGILADEMGLGKTLQTISFLGYLKFVKKVNGPHLVIVPKSTLDNWSREFDKWVPGFNVCVLRGGKEERAETVQQFILPQKFEVLITSYELCLREKGPLKKLAWEYIVIDEAHRIKNVDSMLSQIVREFDSRARLLITGTPLQNNLHELWALLNFLLPDVFSSVEDFDAWFEKQAGPPAAAASTSDAMVLDSAAAAAPAQTEEEAKAAASMSVVKQLHAVLRPFLLRRVKADVEKSLLPKKEINVYVGMTDLQRKWYKMILEKDIDAVNGAGGKKEGKTRLQNIVMQLRKCCNHPYLFDGAEPGPPFTTDEHLVESAGKMIILDRLLKAMKLKGSRVLIFSQMSRVLDILEDYCLFRDYGYCRLDGQTGHDERMEAIDAYNKEGSDKFVFLLTTRAGGLGINLTTADVVVLYDSDWNPQADLQAMDRAHRIGQTKQVYVYRFVTENAVEEKVLERAAQKLRLDQLVIQQGRTQTSKQANKDELVDMIQHGAEKIINSTESMAVLDDIDEIIRRGEEKTKELNSKYAELSFDDLQTFKTEAGSTREWEGDTYGGKKRVGLNWIEPAKRERKSNYSIDSYYRETMRQGVGKPSGPRQPRAPKQLSTEEWKFYAPELAVLQEKENLYFRKNAGYLVPLREDDTANPDDLEAERAEQQAIIDEAEPLTEEEQILKDELSDNPFEHWTKRDYQAFIRGCETYGRESYKDIHEYELPGKPFEEVKLYGEVFWQRYQEVDDWERQLKKIEDGEARRAANERQTKLVKQKVDEAPYPLQKLKIQYINQSKGKTYSEEEDRFLVVSLNKYGLGKEDTYDKIKRDISEFPSFRFDWFFKSRSPAEIGRRCTTLVSLIEKELDDENKKKTKKAAAAAAPATNGSVNGSATKPKAAKAAPKKRKADDLVSQAGSSRASTPAVVAKKPKKEA